jgi:hypothetical protein
MEERRSVYRVSVRKTEGRDSLQDLNVDGRILLNWIFSNWDGGGMDWIYLAQDRE